MDDQHLEQFRREAVEKQQEFEELFRQLTESTQKLFSAAGHWAEDLSREHQRLFDAYLKAQAEMNSAIRLMHEKALAAAGLPKEHPLWDWVHERGDG